MRRVSNDKGFHKLLWLLLILASYGFAEANTAETPTPQVMIKPFTSDGCSLFPNGTITQKQLWLACCRAHDLAYWQGGTREQREQADLDLKLCVAQAGEPHIAELMLTGVRAGGSPYWPTRFRWGYGWPYMRGYKALSKEEHQAIFDSLKALEQGINAETLIESNDGQTQESAKEPL